jgi:hypothetical protein
MSTAEAPIELITRPKRADARRNYEKVLAAARDAFAAGGEATSLEEIARRAGVGILPALRRPHSRQRTPRCWPSGHSPTLACASGSRCNGVPSRGAGPGMAEQLLGREQAHPAPVTGRHSSAAARAASACPPSPAGNSRRPRPVTGAASPTPVRLVAVRLVGRPS